MRLIVTTLLLTFGCATTRTDQPPTTPAAPAPAELRVTLEADEVEWIAAKLETALVNPPPAVPEPTPPEPIWAGYMIVQTDSVPPGVVIFFPKDGIITSDVLADGVQLSAAAKHPKDGYWLFPFTRGALFFRAVRVYDDGRVVVEMPFRGACESTKDLVTAEILRDPSGAYVYTTYIHGVHGSLRRATVGNHIDCEGPCCAKVPGVHIHTMDGILDDQ